MELNEAVLDEPMRAEVKLRRVKRHYHERAYGYEMPVTPTRVRFLPLTSSRLLIHMNTPPREACSNGCSRLSCH